MKCPLSGISINACPVKTCMYYSVISSTHCCAESAEDLSAEELAAHKGLEQSSIKIFRIKKMAVERVQNALILDEFLRFVSLKPTPYKILSGFVDVLVEYGSRSKVLEIALLEWDFDKFAKCLYQPYWEEFFTLNNSTLKPDISSVLGIKAMHMPKLYNRLERLK